MSDSSRPYELVVFGATGFTGKYTCEHIVSHLPTDLKWAVAGRSVEKLQKLVQELQSLHPDRLAPEIETSGIDEASLKKLTEKTKVFITTVGPYHLYGEPAVAACVESGTHYLDVTGESPWHYDMIKKYDNRAKANRAIIIPQIGVDSAPADLLAWSMVTHARRTLSAGVGELVYSLYELKGLPSGGTLATVLSLFESYTLKKIGEASKPWSLSPVAPPQFSPLEGKSLYEKITGVRVVRDLGTLTTSLQGATDATVVGRSWGLFEGGQYYGRKFRFQPYMHARNVFTGALVHFAIVLGMASLLLAPARWLFRQLVFQPGTGPSRESSRNDHLEYRALAAVDSKDPADPKRLSGRLEWNGSGYHLTGVFLAEAAITLLRDQTTATEIGGGFLTPATLGGPYVDRLQKAGLKISVRVLP
ncbi:hypothetical protein MBLNU459_g7542t1 [Dothideomycetes sp. NU459]